MAYVSESHDRAQGPQGVGVAGDERRSKEPWVRLTLTEKTEWSEQRTQACMLSWMPNGAPAYKDREGMEVSLGLEGTHDEDQEVTTVFRGSHHL
jgi:hypothetical protein